MNQFHTFGLKPFMYNRELEAYISHDGFMLKFGRYDRREVKYFSPTGKLLLSEDWKSKDLLDYIKAETCHDATYYEQASARWCAQNENLPVMCYNHQRGNWDCSDGRYLEKDHSKEFSFYQVLYSPEGTVLEKEMDVFSPGFRWKFDKARVGNPELKIGPGHLPKGTLFKAKGLAMGSSDPHRREDYIHMVKSLSLNAPGHYLVETETLVPSLFDDGKMTNYVFSLSFVNEIVSRGWGEVVITDATEKQLRDIDEYDSIHAILRKRVTNALSDKETQHRYINIEKLKKRLMQMGLLRRKIGGWVLTDDSKARKFIKKNPHWALETARFSSRQESFESHKMYSEHDALMD